MKLKFLASGYRSTSINNNNKPVIILVNSFIVTTIAIILRIQPAVKLEYKVPRRKKKRKRESAKKETRRKKVKVFEWRKDLAIKDCIKGDFPHKNPNIAFMPQK